MADHDDRQVFRVAALVTEEVSGRQVSVSALLAVAGDRTTLTIRPACSDRVHILSGTPDESAILRDAVTRLFASPVPPQFETP